MLSSIEKPGVQRNSSTCNNNGIEDVSELMKVSTWIIITG